MFQVSQWKKNQVTEARDPALVARLGERKPRFASRLTRRFWIVRVGAGGIKFLDSLKSC